MAFGASVFVTDAFVREARSGAHLYVSADLIARCLRDESPVLGPAAIRAANSRDGLNLLILHHAWATQLLNADEVRLVRSRLIETFLEMHRGYQIKEILTGRYGEDDLRRAQTGGFLLRTDYAPYYHSHALPLPPPDRRPFLVGITREEAMQSEGSTIASLFVYVRPRFFLKPGEQAVLRLAALGATDGEIARTLHCSSDAVKKRWRALYHRVHQVDPDLLPSAAPVAATPSEPRPETRNTETRGTETRGAEKRRVLLQYLRLHPEELRPQEARQAPRRRVTSAG